MRKLHPPFDSNIPEVKKVNIKNDQPEWDKFLLIFMVGMMVGGMSFGIFVFSGGTSAFMTDGQCEELLINSSMYGYKMALIEVLSQTLTCEGPVPINAGNQTYNIFAVECLGGVQNG